MRIGGKGEDLDIGSEKIICDSYNFLGVKIQNDGRDDDKEIKQRVA